MHFQHHAKPNCFGKDPDINMHPLFFALGKILSVEVSRNISGKVLGEWEPARREGSGENAQMLAVWVRLGPGWLTGSHGRQQAVNKLSRTELPVLPGKCKPILPA